MASRDMRDHRESRRKHEGYKKRSLKRKAKGKHNKQSKTIKMGCCDNDRKKDNDDTEGCCCSNGASDNPRCMRMPYDDGFMIAAQVLSIIAFLMSWVWWVSFIISIIAFVMHQIIWCCRQSKLSLIAAHVVSLVAGILCIFVGIFFLIYRKDGITYCDVFTLETWGDSWNGRDYCPEVGYAIVAFVDAALWFATAGCTIHFACSGRYAKWEERLSNKTTNNVGNNEGGVGAVQRAVEMGNVQTTTEQVEAES